MSVLTFGLVLVLVLAGGLAQCPPQATTLCPGTPTTGGGDEQEGDCLQVNVIDRSIIDGFNEQPIYYAFVPNTTENAQVDSICVSVLPVKDNNHTFIYYYARTFANGSTAYETYVVSSNSTGINRYGTVGHLYTEYIIGRADCNTFVIYSCGDYGDYSLPYVYGTTTDYNSLPLCDDCLESAVEIIESSGLPVGEYIALPYNLPTVCQAQHLCLPTSNPLYEAQGGTCEPYEETEC